MDFIETKIQRDKFVSLKIIRPKWDVQCIEDLRETATDFQVIEVLHGLAYCSKTEKKTLIGLLNKRNECAHPSEYYPNLNEALGYVSEILSRMAALQKKWL